MRRVIRMDHDWEDWLVIGCAAAVPVVSSARAFHEAGCDLAPPGDQAEHCQKERGFGAAEDVLEEVGSNYSST